MLTLQTKNQTKAEVKQGALILYLPTAIKPCVWRMGLDTLSETSIEIDEKDNIFVLATRDINGVTKAIAGFHKKEDAEKALATSLNALIRTQMPGDSVNTFFSGRFLGRVLKWGGGLIILLWLASILLGTPTPTPINVANTQNNQQLLDENGRLRTGVPIDVDRLFEGAGE